MPANKICPWDRTAPPRSCNAVALFRGKFLSGPKPRTVAIASAVVMTAATVSYSVCHQPAHVLSLRHPGGASMAV